MGLNDPQWGNKNNNGGPPDLEELLRKLNAKVSSLFGGKGGAGKPGGGEPMHGFAGGMSLIAEKSGLKRESVSRALSVTGNPRLSSLNAILSATGLQIAIKQA